MSGEDRGLCERHAGREREGDERVTQVVEPDGLPTVTIESCGIASCVDSSKCVAPRLRASTASHENEGVGVDAAKVA